ncbi:MAG: putative bicarbonate transporter, IctB family [Gloeomargaritaceae cyanobacterium C42_A2020_066]|nr:putative bicarbonate transporter, IctB family [Gloeomargaritaceae cyanobacterium C42_A2020_066]
MAEPLTPNPASWQRGSYLWRWLGRLSPWGTTSWTAAHLPLLVGGFWGLVLVLLPVAPNPLIGLLLLGGAVLWSLVRLVTPPQGPALMDLWGLVLIYGAMVILAVVFSPVRPAAVDGGVKVLLYLVSFGLLTWTVGRPAWRSRLLLVYLLVSLGVAVYGLRQWFFGAETLATWVDPESPLANTSRVYSTLGNPNLLAGYLLPSVGWGLAALLTWRTWPTRLLAVTLVGLNGACLILTLSRGAWLGLAAMVGVMAILLGSRWWQQQPSGKARWLLVLGVIVGLILLAGAAWQVEPLRLRLLSIAAGRGDSSNNFRLNVWAAVWDMVRDFPWTGIGPGNDAFNRVYPFYQRPNFNALGTYSIPLEILVEAGVFGFLAFVSLTLSILRHAWQNLGAIEGPAGRVWQVATIGVLVGLMVHGLFDTVWYRPQVQLLWWFAVALAVIPANPRPAGSDAEVEPPSEC